jgi:hypothetical protein
MPESSAQIVSEPSTQEAALTKAERAWQTGNFPLMAQAAKEMARDIVGMFPFEIGEWEVVPPFCLTVSRLAENPEYLSNAIDVASLVMKKFNSEAVASLALKLIDRLDRPEKRLRALMRFARHALVRRSFVRSRKCELDNRIAACLLDNAEKVDNFSLKLRVEAALIALRGTTYSLDMPDAEENYVLQMRASKIIFDNEVALGGVEKRVRIMENITMCATPEAIKMEAAARWSKNVDLLDPVDASDVMEKLMFKMMDVENKGITVYAGLGTEMHRKWDQAKQMTRRPFSSPEDIKGFMNKFDPKGVFAEDYKL